MCFVVRCMEVQNTPRSTASRMSPKSTVTGQLLGALAVLIASLSLSRYCEGALWGRQAGSRTPTFELIPKGLKLKGENYLSQLQEAGSAESFLDKLFGFDCYGAALQGLGNECSRLSQVEKSRLALGLTACHLQQLGQEAKSCPNSRSLKQCAEALDDRGYSTYLKFLAEIDCICLFIQSQDFQKHAEHMLNVLYAGSRFATEAMVETTSKLHKQGQNLDAVSNQLNSVHKLQAEVANNVERNLYAVQSVHQKATALQEQMESSLALEMRIWEKQVQALLDLEQHETAEEERALESVRRWETAEVHAKALIEEQAAYRHTQQLLLQDLREISDRSDGLKESMSAVLSYAQRSDAVLVRLLGQAYSIDDVAFYGASCMGVVASGATAATAPARVPLAGFLAGALALERVCLNQLRHVLAIDDLGQVRLPGFGFLMPGISAKWVIRQLFLASALGMLLRTCCAHRRSDSSARRELCSVRQAVLQADARQQQALHDLRLQILADLDRISSRQYVQAAPTENLLLQALDRSGVPPQLQGEHASYLPGNCDLVHKDSSALQPTQCGTVDQVGEQIVNVNTPLPLREETDTAIVATGGVGGAQSVQQTKLLGEGHLMSSTGRKSQGYDFLQAAAADRVNFASQTPRLHKRTSASKRAVTSTPGTPGSRESKRARGM